MAVDLRHLRYFVAVAETGSFSGAALGLRITQPALSRLVSDLETELGVRLFERAGRRVRLSAAGEELLQRGRQLLADAESLGEHARALGRGDRGILRIGVTPQTLQSLVAGFMTRYRRRRPAVEIHLTEEGGIRLLALVERGDLHLGIGAVPRTERLRARRLFPYRVLAVAARAHDLARRRHVELSALRDERLLLLRRDFGSRVTFDGACRAAGLRLRAMFESGEPHSLVALAEEGHGVAIVPSTVRVTSPRVRATPILWAGGSLGGEVAITWNPRRFLPPYAEAFVEQLAAHTRGSYPGRHFERTAPPVR